MFDIDKYEKRLHEGPPAVPTSAYDLVSNVKEMSLLFWGEHCVECAAPACYESCDLFQPRPDKRCRRFTYGAFKNRNFSSLRGYGVEISFKKWAKIEASGRLSLYPVSGVLWRERLVQWAAPLADALGRIIARLTGKDNWSSVSYISLAKLASRKNRVELTKPGPDAFLVEVYNPGQETVRMQLNILPGQAEGPLVKDLARLGPSFVTTLVFPSGYSRHEIEASRFLSLLAAGNLFKISMIPEADTHARLVFLTADFVTFQKQPIAATQPPKVKCLIWDLDNTLWSGILIEGDNVVVRPEIVQLLKQLDERGILLSIASKNDHASAWQRLTQLGLAEYFLHPQITWLPKSMGIKTIAEKLNIGLDALAFIDDNPFELDQVGRTIPEVVRVNASDVATILTDPRFQGSTSAESRQRRQFYRETMAREDAQKEFGSNYLQFLASCGINLEIAPYSVEHFERVAELVQRTNQLNFSGHKYTREQLNEILADERLEKYVLKSSDNYGSYGTVGFSIVEQGDGIMQIRDFMLSCRVQGKFIEQAFFSHLLEHHNPQGARSLWLNYNETARNKPALQVLDSLGFRKCSRESNRLMEGRIHSSPESLRCDFIQVQCVNPAETLNRSQVETIGTANSSHQGRS